MTITEKITKKDKNTIHLYKEGVFWIAYESDAYLVSQVKKLKPTKKYIKSIEREIVSVGFPSVSLEEVIGHYAVKEKTGTMVVLETDTPADEKEFEEWKERLEVRLPKQSLQKETSENDYFTECQLSEKIKTFRLHTATPMDCMRFIEQLQQEC